MSKKRTKPISYLNFMLYLLACACAVSSVYAKGPAAQGVSKTEVKPKNSAARAKPKSRFGQGALMKWDNVKNIPAKKPGSKARPYRSDPEWRYVPVRRF